MEELEKEIERKKLKKWADLEKIKEKIFLSLREENVKEYANNVLKYVSISFDVSIEDLKELPWLDIAKALMKALRTNRIILEIPMLLKTKKKEESPTKIEYSWDYPEREWFDILAEFSSAYGWSIEYIENLDVDNAMALLQEIRIKDQIDKEFMYSLSEIAYPYDESRKTRVFKPLERPEWMKEVVTVSAPKKVRIRRDMIPMGVVVGHRIDE